uniref:Uncharacterized protein n=1 Tax=Arundo donax TaxID=35708 RepID=A0A0A9FJ52_ARUDO
MYISVPTELMGLPSKTSKTKVIDKTIRHFSD